MVDERYVRIQSELKHSLEVLQEEQTRVVKIETVKKSLEVEVKNLTVRLEEVEASAIAGGKRVISKLEARVRRLGLRGAGWEGGRRGHHSSPRSGKSYNLSQGEQQDKV